MSDSPARVIKLGGSLLDWPEWPARLRAWLARQSPATNILIVGGGALVEALRELDRVHHLPTDTSHWSSIRAMGITAAVAEALVREARLVSTLNEVSLHVPTGGIQILDVEAWLRENREILWPMPTGWEVTSDSLAARAAICVPARELVLLKSALPEGTRRQAWAGAGYVDAHFPEASLNLSVRCVNLREPSFPETSAD